MYCNHCGIKFDIQPTFCPKCGKKQEMPLPTQYNMPIYQLPPTDKRKYSIEVWIDKIIISGKFFYLKNKEFHRNKKTTDTAFLYNYLGTGYLSQRSYLKTLIFLISGTLLELAKLALDKLNELADSANDYLKWFDMSIKLPGWMNNTINILAIICILLGIVLLFSKKKVIEISFTDKRICVPQKSMTPAEYTQLYRSIMNAKRMQ